MNKYLNKGLMFCALVSGHALAEPWIETDSPLLRSSIDALVNSGVIKRPVNTYPLMWQGLAQDLEHVNPGTLPDSAQFAYYHLKQALRFARRETVSGVRLSANSAPRQQQGFETREQARSAVETFGSITGKRVSAKLSMNVRRDANDGKKLDHNNSYLAVLLGNWSVSAEKINHWWGPGNENALVLSNNASPMSGIRLSRHGSDYFGPSWLSFIGPWQLSALYAKQKPVAKSSESDTFWGVRASSTPLQGLELGLSITDSEQMRFPELTGDLLLTDTPSETRLSAVDFKYSTRLFSQPFAAYGEWAGHKQSGLIARDASYTLGLETYFGTSQRLIKSYLEYSDTSNACLAQVESYNCNYGSELNPGYNQRGQLIGPAVGMDVKSTTLGLTYHRLNGYGGYLKLRHLDFTARPASRIQLELGYQQELLKGLFKAAVTLTREERDDDTRNHQALRGSWEYRF